MKKILELAQTKIFLYSALGLLVILSLLEYKQWKQAKEINIMISDLNQQSDKYQKSNVDLQNLIATQKTNEYKDMIAREQFNLKKDGENVYSFVQSSAGASAQSSSDSKKEDSNPKKWLNYFFKPQG